MRERLRTVEPAADDIAMAAKVSSVVVGEATAVDPDLVGAFASGHVSQMVDTAIDVSRNDAQIPVVLCTT